MRNLFILFLFCALVFGVMVVMQRRAPIQLDPQTDAPMAFSYTRLDGKTGQLADHNGRPVVIHFWATWCPPCLKELPELIDKAAQTPEVDFLIISVDRDQSELRRFLHPYEKKTQHPNIFLIHDLGMKIAAATLKISSFPETFLLNRDLVSVLHYRGPVKWVSFDYSSHI